MCALDKSFMRTLNFNTDLWSYNNLSSIKILPKSQLNWVEINIGFRRTIVIILEKWEQNL